MRGSLLLVALAATSLALCASGCNCGRQTITMTEASLTIPLDELEFGVVAEGTSKGGKFRVENVGRASVNVEVSLADGGSADFALGSVPVSIQAGGFIEVPVIFTPTNPGEDEGAAELNIAGGTEQPLRVRLHGGPIFPSLAFDPDPLDFRPATMQLELKTVQLRSVGTAALTIRSVGVAATGNPQFALVPPALPSRLLPGESLAVRVEYARNGLTTEGLLEVLSDDADGGLRTLRLLPDRAAECSDLIDNDQDGLTDFPADPGCQDAADTDETNAAQCVNGGTQPCGDGGVCGGLRTCVNGAWGACTGGTSCEVDAGVDAGMPDAGPCDVSGLWRVDGGAITYSCSFGLVNIGISRFNFATNVPAAGTMTVAPQQTWSPGSSQFLQGANSSCPSGTLSASTVFSGSCDETYTLTGSFTGPNSFEGTFGMSFSGTCFDCTARSVPVQLLR